MAINNEVYIDYETIGFRIGQRRRQLKLKQRELADILNISPKYLSNIETGSKHVSLETIISLSLALDTTVDYFLLGCIRRSIDDNIADMLKLCTERDKKVIYEMAQIFVKNNQ